MLHFYLQPFFMSCLQDDMIQEVKDDMIRQSLPAMLVDENVEALAPGKLERAHKNAKALVADDGIAWPQLKGVLLQLVARFQGKCRCADRLCATVQ